MNARIHRDCITPGREPGARPTQVIQKSIVTNCTNFTKEESGAAEGVEGPAVQFLVVLEVLYRFRRRATRKY